jgi:serine/threonine protein kinase/Tfp pilus assembly protein PilF
MVDWQRVREVFDAALGKKPEERRSYLNETCCGDKELRSEVESLLSSLAESDQFLETPAVAHVASLIRSETNRLEKGARLGHYEIIGHIGAGGMGDVYLAQDLKLDRRIAIKTLNEEFSKDELNLQRFVREAKAASALNHPNILVIHEICDDQDKHYIVSEFVDGKTLREVHRQSPSNFAEILNVSIQIADALSAAHDAHLVHRDIKPENVMLRPDGYVKVLDFGLAKLVGEKGNSAFCFAETTSRQNQTEQGMILGTVNYMAPEQAKAEEVDERADIFSLGTVIYEMIAGRTPFASGSKAETFASLINAEPAPLSRFVSNVPDDLQRIVSKALRKNKMERYQAMSELLTDLKDCRDNWRQEKSETPHPRNDATADLLTTTTAARIPARTSSAAYLFAELMQHEGSSLLIMTAIAAALIAVAYFGYAHYRSSDKTNALASSELSPIRSIAVLPFSNASHNADTEYLSDGISETLINSLSPIPSIKVISRGSSFRFKGKEADPQEVGTALGVEAILTGRVVQRGDDFSINVELVDTHNGTQIWGAQYTRKGTDLLAVQSEISTEIAEKLRLKLTASEQRQLNKQGTENLKAYELLLHGRFNADTGTSDNRKKALDYYRRAIDIDPAYALAYVELSKTYTALLNNNLIDPREAAPLAEAAARKALELDDRLAEAHLAMGTVKLNAWDWSAAEQEFKHAIDLNPNLSRAHIAYFFYLTQRGRYEEAAAEARRAIEVDPLSTLAKTSVVYSLLMSRQNKQAIEAVNEMIAHDQRNPDLYGVLAQAYKGNKQYREAIGALEDAMKLGDDSPDLQILLGTIYPNVGESNKTRAILKKLATGKDYVSPIGLAILHAALGEREQAFAFLERAYAAHDQQFIWLRIESESEQSEFGSLRFDPRFQDLLRRTGL